MIKQISVALLWLLAVVHTGHADEKWFQYAQAYAESGKYPVARKIYQKLLTETNDPAQRSILFYNIGTTFLKEQQWDEALAQYDKVNQLSTIAPGLRQNLYVNMAIALIEQVRQGLQQKPEFVQLTGYKALLTEAGVDLKEAQDAACALLKVEGAPECKPPLSMQVLQSLVKKQTAELDQLIAQAKLTHAAKKEQELTPQGLLELLIEQQNNVLDLTNTYLQQGDGEEKQKLQQATKVSQDAVLAKVAEFPPAVLTMQKERYRSKEKNLQCQDKPWDEVIPLFDQGYRQALIAQKILNSSPDLYRQSSQFQKNTVVYWLKALEKLKQFDAQKESQTQNQQQTQADQSLQLLSEMETNDLIPAVAKPPQPVERPW